MDDQPALTDDVLKLVVEETPATTTTAIIALGRYVMSPGPQRRAEVAAWHARRCAVERFNRRRKAARSAPPGR